jgi:hypothetical protein
MSEHKVELVLRVDGEDVETLAFDARQASLVLQRRDDGLVVGWFAVDDEGSPPQWLLSGGAGYPGAHTLVFRRLQIGAGQVWRLVKALGWDPEK